MALSEDIKKKIQEVLDEMESIDIKVDHIRRKYDLDAPTTSVKRVRSHLTIPAGSAKTIRLTPATAKESTVSKLDDAAKAAYETRRAHAKGSSMPEWASCSAEVRAIWKDVAKNAISYGGSSGPIPGLLPGEPFYVLFGRDPTAAGCVEEWILYNRKELGSQHEAITNAKEVAEAMKEFAKEFAKAEKAKAEAD